VAPAVGGSDMNTEVPGDRSQRPAVLQRRRLAGPFLPLVQPAQRRTTQGVEGSQALMATIALQTIGLSVPTYALAVAVGAKRPGGKPAFDNCRCS